MSKKTNFLGDRPVTIILFLSLIVFVFYVYFTANARIFWRSVLDYVERLR